jgi:hypothetical protein
LPEVAAAIIQALQLLQLGLQSVLPEGAAIGSIAEGGVALGSTIVHDEP